MRLLAHAANLPTEVALAALTIGLAVPPNVVAAQVASREAITVAGMHGIEPHVQGVVAFGMSTRVTRGLSAFAEARCEASAATPAERKLPVGIRSLR